jgi:hypothetical protein
MTLKEHIFRDGYIAYVHDHAKSHNPYPENHPQKIVWDAGWQYADDNGVVVRFVNTTPHRNAEDREG